MKRTESVEEKRKYGRIELAKIKYNKIVTPYIKTLRIKQYEGLEISSAEWDIVALKDLSAGGALFYYSKYLGLGSLLDLKIDVSTTMPTVKCAGKVTRIEEPQPLLTQEGQPLNSVFRIATEFTEIDEQEKELINTTVEKILGKEAKKKNFYLEKLEKATTGSIRIKKEFLKTKNVCRVTFRLQKAAAPDAKSVYIVGDFNNWDIHANSMKKRKNEDYTITLDLEPGREYQFRYLIDESKWENDWKADKYVKSPYGDSDNSVVTVT